MRAFVELRPAGRVAGLLAGLCALGLVALLSLRIGAVDVTTADAVDALFAYRPDSYAQTVVRTLRLPRVLTAALVGAALAMSGAIFQGLVRNPLVSPDVIGINAGAGLAAVAWIVSGQHQAALPAVAFAGAVLAAAAVYALSWTGHQAGARLVLVGIGCNALLRAAYERAYRLPAGFAGFRARVRYLGPAGAVTGDVEVRSPGDLTLDLPGADPEATAWVRQELASIAGHRWPTSHEAADGRHRLALRPAAPDGEPDGAEGADDLAVLGTLVRVLDDRFRSSYRVRDGQIAVIDRSIGGMRFVIQVLDRVAAPDGRHVPAHFVVSYWETESGRLTRADAYADRYAPVQDGGPAGQLAVLLPSSRTVTTAGDGGLTVRTVELEGHTLLHGADATPASAASAPPPEHGRTRAG